MNFFFGDDFYRLVAGIQDKYCGEKPESKFAAKPSNREHDESKKEDFNKEEIDKDGNS